MANITNEQLEKIVYEVLLSKDMLNKTGRIVNSRKSELKQVISKNQYLTHVSSGGDLEPE